MALQIPPLLPTELPPAPLFEAPPWHERGHGPSIHERSMGCPYCTAYIEKVENYQTFLKAQTEPRPIAETEAIIRIWRGFTIREGSLLTGLTGVKWYSDTLQAQCNGAARAVPPGLAHYPEAPNLVKQAEIHLSHGACTCGIYGYYHEKIDEAGPYVTSMEVSAECVAWGYVVDHGNGVRAQYAKLLTLTLNQKSLYRELAVQRELAQRLHFRYNVPVFTSRDTGERRLLYGSVGQSAEGHQSGRPEQAGSEAWSYTSPGLYAKTTTSSPAGSYRGRLKEIHWMRVAIALIWGSWFMSLFLILIAGLL